MALKGVVNLQALIRGHNVRKRAKMTLQCIQSLVRVQALVCDQRRRLSCEATSLGSMFSNENNGRNSSVSILVHPFCLDLLFVHIGFGCSQEMRLKI